MSQHSLGPFATGSQPAVHIQPSETSEQESGHMRPPGLQGQPPERLQSQANPRQDLEIPDGDASVLANIPPDQLAAIARLIQSGALKLPLQATAPLALQPPAPSTQSFTATQPTSSDLHLQSAQSTMPEASNEVDMEREEGEVEEGELDNGSNERGFLRPPPIGPRERTAMPRVSAAPRLPPSERVGSLLGPRAPGLNGRVATSKSVEAKRFVLQMHNAGYTFQQLARNFRDPKPLRRLFVELGLPVTARAGFTSQQPPNGNGLSASEPALSTTEPSSGEQSKAAPVKRALPSKPAAVDRGEYLARLQAAKNKKSETAVSSQPPEPPKKSAFGPRINESTSSGAQAQPVGKSIDKNEILRQKIEKLKLEQAAKRKIQPATDALNKPSPATTAIQEGAVEPPNFFSPAHNGLGAGIADISAKASQMNGRDPKPGQSNPAHMSPAPSILQGALSPMSPAAMAFSGLPGLFLAGTPKSQAQQAVAAPPFTRQSAGTSKSKPSTPSASPAPLAVARKRPVAADFDDFPTKSKTVKRPFGQSRNASEDESLIIEVSDEEDSGDGEDSEEPGTLLPNSTKPQTKSFRDVPPLTGGLPMKSTYTAQASSPGTPGAGVSGSTLYQRKMQEMEDLKRKLMEKMQKQKEAKLSAPKEDPSSTAMEEISATTTSAPDTPVPQSTPKVANVPLAVETPALDGLLQPTTGTDAAMSKAESVDDRPESAATLIHRREKQRLEQRLTELEQNEMRDVDEAVDAAAAAEARLETLTGRPREGTFAETNGNTLHASQQESQTGIEHRTEPSDSLVEEGELSDDSMSNFYDVPDGQDQKVIEDTAEEADGGASLPGEWPWPDSLSDDGELGQSSAPQIGPETQIPLPPAVGARNEEEGSTSALQAETHTELEGQVAKAVDEDSMDDDEDHSSAKSEDNDMNDLIQDTSKQHSSAFQDAEDGGDDDAPSVITSSPASSTSSEDNGEYVPELSLSDTVANDIAPELQPNAEQQQPVVVEEPSKRHTYFTPYHSPLALFRDYRYHPDFLSNISGGHKSLTYSHNIDTDKFFCPYEASGGACNDKSCQYQHFDTMGLNDNELLQKIGTRNIPTQDPEGIKRWNEGMASLVKQLKTSGIGKDAGAIAERIAQFRRDFVGNVVGEVGKVVYFP